MRTSVWVACVMIFAVVQLCTADNVAYDQKLTLDDNLSLNSNQCHHPLITQLSWKAVFVCKSISLVLRRFARGLRLNAFQSSCQKSLHRIKFKFSVTDKRIVTCIMKHNYRNHQFNNFLVRRRKNYGSLIKSILVSVM